jgi:hypothetical protein
MASALIRAGLVAVAAVWAFAAQTASADGTPNYVKQGSRAAGLSSCVEPTDYMRRNHMELIKHQRDDTVRHGIRGTRYSLSGCIDCHVSHGPNGQPVAVDSPHQFCNACHSYAAVSVPCFDCHAAIPRGGPLSESAMAEKAAESASDAKTGSQSAAGEAR